MQSGKNMTLVNRVLLVGLGSIGKRHLNNLQKLLPQAKIAVMRSRQDGSSVACCEVVTSIESAIDFQPQLAVICSPSSLHMKVAGKLAEAGVHLFIEKPLSNQVQGVEPFIEKINRNGLKVMVGYNLRFSPSLIAFKALLDAAEYGSVLAVNAEVGQYLPSWRPDVDYRSTVSAQAVLGGGVLLELSHELDYLIWLFGPAVSTSARLMNVSDLDIDVEDLVLAHIDFKKGKRSLTASLQMDFLQRKPSRICKVICEKATIIWDAIAGCVEIVMQDRTHTYFQDEYDRNFTYEQELLAFIHSVEHGTPVPIDSKDGLRVLQLAKAMRNSSKSGKVVYL